MNNLFSHIKEDAFGGITAGIVALPLALEEQIYGTFKAYLRSVSV